MYQEILYEIVIFDHILGEGGWYMNIYGRRLLRPERSSAARRCACLFYLTIDIYAIILFNLLTLYEFYLLLSTVTGYIIFFLSEDSCQYE